MTFTSKKEAELNTKDDSKFFDELKTKSVTDIVDGLLKKYPNEKSAIQAIDDHLNSKDSIYKKQFPQLIKAKNKIYNLLMDSTDMTFGDRLKAIINEALNRKYLSEDESSKEINIDGYIDDSEEAKNNEAYQKDLYYNVGQGFVIKADSNSDGTPTKRGNYYVRRNLKNIKDKFFIHKGLSDDKESKVGFLSKDEAENTLAEYLNMYPNAKAHIIEMYTAEDDEAINKTWYPSPEKAYPYSEWKKQEEIRQREIQNAENNRIQMQNIKTDDNKKKSVINKPARAAKDAEYFDRRNSIRDEEIYQYIINGIHPDWDYEKPMWRWIKPDGEKMVFVLDGIDSSDKIKTYVYIRPISVIRTESGKKVLKPGDPEAIPAEVFVNIVHNDLNKDVYTALMKNKSLDPEDWLDEYNYTKQKMRDHFNNWYEQNKDYMFLDDYSKKDQIKLYQLINKDGYSPKEAINILNKKYKKESIDLEEAEKLEVIKDPKQIKEVLEQLNINPEFVDLPITIEYEDLGDDSEPPFKFNIVGVPYGPVDKIKELYVRDWDKGGRMFSMDLESIYNALEADINQEPEVDLWDMASTLNKQHRSLNKGKAGKWQELTRDQIITALQMMEQSDKYKGIDLVGKYLEKQTFATRNPLVGKALKDLDPERAIKPTKNAMSLNGIAYQIFIPAEGYDRLKPPSKGNNNPYKDMMKAWQ